MRYEHDAEFHAARMELINEQRAQVSEQLTRRERFAMAAMQGMLSQYKPISIEPFVKRAVVYADALIAEIDKEVKP